jgi:hypothetical protein
VGFTENPSHNLMLDKQVLRTEEKPMGHKSSKYVGAQVNALDEVPYSYSSINISNHKFSTIIVKLGEYYS